MIIRIMLLIVLFIALIPASASVTTPLAGDLDGDGQVTVTDAKKALRIVVGLDTAVPSDIASGKVTAPYDYVIHLRDVVLILKDSMGLLGASGLGTTATERTVEIWLGARYSARLSGSEFLSGQTISVTEELANGSDDYIELTHRFSGLTYGFTLGSDDGLSEFGDVGGGGGGFILPGASRTETTGWDQRYDAAAPKLAPPGLYAVLSPSSELDRPSDGAHFEIPPMAFAVRILPPQ